MAEQNASRPVVRMKVESEATPQPKAGPQIKVAGAEATTGSAQVAVDKAAAQSSAPTSVAAPRPRVEAPAAKVDVPSVAVEPEQPVDERPALKTTIVVEHPEVEQPVTQRPAVKASVVVEQPEAEQPAQEQVPSEPKRATEQAPANDAPVKAAAAPNADADGRLNRARLSVTDWVRKTFPGHEHAFWGGVLALFIALLVFMIGLWRVLFIGIVVVIGVAVGQVLDGDPKLVNAIRNLLDSERGQR